MPVTLSQIHEARTVTLTNGERYRFSWIEPAAALDLSGLNSRILEDRRYISEVISRLLADPKVPPEEFDSWPDTLLLELANRFLSLGNSKASGEAQEPDLAGCRHALQDAVEADLKRLHESSRQVIESLNKSIARIGLWDVSLLMTPIWSQLDQFKTFQDAVANSVLDVSKRLNDVEIGIQGTINRMVEAQTNLGIAFQKIITDQARFRSLMSDSLSGFTTYDLTALLSGWTAVMQSASSLHWSEVRRTRRAALLIDSQLGFLNDLADEAIEDLIDNATHLGRLQRRAYISRKLHEFTSSEAFWMKLEEELKASPTSRRRANILRTAHQAHRDRLFELTVPVLYAQIEGLLASVLNEMGLIRWSRKARRWYQTNPETGKYRLVDEWKDGKPTGKRKKVPLTGLRALTEQGNSKTPVSLSETVTHLRDDVSSARNLVMHGIVTDYGTSLNSSRLLLLALILAREIRQLQTSAGKI